MRRRRQVSDLLRVCEWTSKKQAHWKENLGYESGNLKGCDRKLRQEIYENILNFPQNK